MNLQENPGRKKSQRKPGKQPGGKGFGRSQPLKAEVIVPQKADILHLDETHWYESGKLYWLWVAVTTKTAVFHIGSGRKEELSYLVTEAFIGWLIILIPKDRGV